MFKRQVFINAFASNPYYYFAVIIITLSGGLYSFSILPAYDPTIINSQYPLLISYAYNMGFWGGLLILMGLLVSLYDKIYSLIVQSIGIPLQAGGALMLTMILLPSKEQAAYIVPLSAGIAVCHLFQINKIRRELKVAGAKLALAESSISQAEARR